jgi:hypothetical protein
MQLGMGTNDGMEEEEEDEPTPTLMYGRRPSMFDTSSGKPSPRRRALSQVGEP